MLKQCYNPVIVIYSAHSETEEAGISQSAYRWAEWMAGVQFLAGARIFLVSMQISSGAHSVSYSMGTGDKVARV
jgi:hypothetical protein